jgi:hypothetical protein
MIRPFTCFLAVGALGIVANGCAGSGDKPHSASSGAAQALRLESISTAEPGGSHFMGDEDDDDVASGRTAANKSDTDADSDNDSPAAENKSYYDADDGSFRNYGQAASASDAKAIVEVVDHYYAAAIADDGVRGCSLMYSVFANNVPLDYGSGAGPPYSRGSTCAVVMTKIFRHFHGTLVAASAITGVRVQGEQARALIGSKSTPASYFPLNREGGAWKVDCLLAIPLS